MSYLQAINAARELFELDDPFDTYAEYARGVVSLLARLYGLPEVDSDTRMTEIARDIGLSVTYG